MIVASDIPGPVLLEASSLSFFVPPTRCVVPLLSTLLLGILPSLTSAKEDPGAPPDPVTVASIEFTGVDALPEGELRTVMQTKTPSRIPFAKKPLYQVAELKQDVARIEALYDSRGYPEARVERVAADVDPDARTVAIVVTVAEGAPRPAGRVTFTGFQDVEASRLDGLTGLAGYQVGAPLQTDWIEEIRENALFLLRDAGYAQAAVEIRELPGEDGATDLTFAATPGPQLRIGDIEYVGLTSVAQDVVRRRLAFAPGDAFRESRIDETERALRSLELFEFAYVQPRRDESTGEQVPIRVTVAEGRHRRTDLGVGYGTEERARVQGSWRNVNVGGRGRTVGLEGRASSLEWGARASVLEPFFFTRRLSLGGTAHWWFENEPIYRMRTYGGRSTVTWQHDTRDIPRQRGSSSSVGVTVINDYTRYSVADFALDDASYRAQLISLGLDPQTGEAQGTLVGLRLQLQHSSVLNPLDGRQGQAMTVALERAGGLLSGDFTYTELVGDARAYRTLGGVVLAARGRAGAIAAGDDNTAVPFFKRYFLGGSTSLRGWGRYDVSPLTDSGLPIGGLALLETSAEARVPVTASLSLVGFVDAGNVWGSGRDIDFGDLRVSVGPGIRYATPIGPVRLDFGYQLTPIDGLVVRGRPEQRNWRVHFSIGQAF